MDENEVQNNLSVFSVFFFLDKDITVFMIIFQVMNDFLNLHIVNDIPYKLFTFMIGKNGGTWKEMFKTFTQISYLIKIIVAKD